MIKLIISAVFFIVVILSECRFVYAQDNFSVGGQYRARTEFRNGYRTLTADSLNPAFFIGQRSRVVFDYKKDNISFYTSIQDSRTWGDEEQRKDLGGLQVNEVWLELLLMDDLALKMGRQEIAYDDHRLLGNLDWGNLSLSHDALVLKYSNKDKGFSFHAGGGFNQVGEPIFGTDYNLKNYKVLAFAWLKKELPDMYSNVTFIGIMNGLPSVDSSSKSLKSGFTLGPIYKYENKGVKALIGGYYQTGLTDNNRSISAFMVNMYGEYRNSDLSVGVGLDYMTGNANNTPANEQHGFTTLYATNHKFYGYMDYFITFPTDTRQQGFTDLYLRFGVNPVTNVTTTVDVHSFGLANELNLGSATVKKHLGVEVDFLVDYKPSKIINLQFGYSMMFANSNMELLKGGSSSNYNGWAFLMLKVSPTFFTTAL